MNGAEPRAAFNGVHGRTGAYLWPPARLREVAAAAGAEGAPKFLALFKALWRRLQERHLGLAPGADPGRFSDTGWAVVVHADEDPAVLRALAPLIEHRRRQVGSDELVKVFEDYRGEPCESWLAQRRVSAGAVVPSRLPYYVLLAGGPEKIPFAFCQTLDVEYAVGVLDFDRADEYARYAESVVRYETAAAVEASREAVFFGTRHPSDAATELSAASLVLPLVDGVDGEPGVASRWGFRSRGLLGGAADKAGLRGILAPRPGSARPSLLFTATHGIGLPPGDPAQRAEQGALLCQDWPGLGEISPADYFAARDMPADARVHGLVAFHFACFGAGTPERDLYPPPGEAPPALAPRPFVSALPKALLSHPNGSALACIGHVERAWGYSIGEPSAGTQLQVFQYALGRMLRGEPVGHAMKDFNERYAALSVTLSNVLHEIGLGRKVPDAQLAQAWTERNDAGGYLVLGDPAVRLRTDVLD